MKKQLELLKKYGVTNYTIENEKIVINGNLYLSSLTSCDKEFLTNTTINGSLDLSSLTSCDKNILNKNIKQLVIGYNKELSYCFFDGILSKVLNVKIFKEYTVYVTTFDIVVQKNDFTAHGKTLKKAIEDVEFKIISQKLKHTPILPETQLTVKYYRLLTGACDIGCRDWMQRNNIDFKIVDGNTVEQKPMIAKELLPILEKSNAYGIEKFKSLINW